MKYIADLHIHSHYSMATSKKLEPQSLDYWGRLKGIQVVGTGDFTHPGWVKELKEKLEPAEEGLYKLKDEYIITDRYNRHLQDAPATRFILTAEISNIYKKYGKVRKIHNVVFAPDFITVDALQEKLAARKFNITSDGRPILGMDARDLLEMIMEVNPRNVFIPAHIWTPWFSALGEKSGFNSIEEAFADMSPNIFAVETGLSSDPPMNWMISSLDRYTLVANSDAHSPEKLGRNANIFNTALNYGAIADALQSADPEKFQGTIDMFPQAGKYHYAGHRKCGIRLDPVEALRHNNVCPECGKPVTMGVMNRVVALSDRTSIQDRPNKLPFKSIIPLKEMLAEINGVGENTRKVQDAWHQLVEKFGTEFHLLLEVPVNEIKDRAGEGIAEAIRRMRNREVLINEGFDGQYGQIKVFGPGELEAIGMQNRLFAGSQSGEKRRERPLLNFDLKEYQRLQNQSEMPVDNDQPLADKEPASVRELHPDQQKAARHNKGPALVIAGPGTGKTRVLTNRIAWLIDEKNVPANHIAALTFTHKAAGEMQERLQKLLSRDTQPFISTFHGLGLDFLKAHYAKTGRSKAFTLFGDEEKTGILSNHLKVPANRQKNISKAISALKQHRNSPEEMEEQYRTIWQQYQEALKHFNGFDLDDLLFEMVQVLRQYPDVSGEMQEQMQYVLVDEYQDINQVQYDLLHLLIREDQQNFFAIGDPNQAIYGFRGSDVRFIKRFASDFPTAHLYHLQQSFRCSDTILKASGNVLEMNELKTDSLHGVDAGVKLRIVEQQSDKSEAEFIARKIEEMMGGLRFFSMDSNISSGNEAYGMESLSDFAVLARTKKQLQPIARAMEHHSVPYQLVSENPVMDDETVKMLVGMMKQLMHPDSEIPETGHELDEQTRASLMRAKVPDILDALIKRYAPEFPEQNQLLYNRLKHMAEDSKESLNDFFYNTVIRREVDAMTAGEQVPLMTLHASKGLEFECVFIAGCEEGLLPFNLFNKDVDRDEERRLLYVGMTRAKSYLFLSHAQKRQFNNRMLTLNRSAFLHQIEKQYYERLEQEKVKTPQARQLGLFD